MNGVIISLLLVAILVLMPILLKDIFGITFTKKTKEVSLSEVKNKLKTKVGKIKSDYLLLGFVFFGMVAFIFYSFLNNRGSSPKIPATLQWLLASIITVLVVFLAIKVIRKDSSKKQTAKKPGAENGGLLRKKTNTLKSWISWGNVLSMLLIIGLGVFVYYQVTKPEEPGPNQTGWISAKSNDASKARQFDLQKVNEISAISDMEFDQRKGDMLHFASAGSDTLVYTVIKAEDYTRYWSVTAWVTNDTLFERRLDIEPYDIAKVGRSYLKVAKDCKVIVWKKVVKVVP